ncbi:MAG: hypothetical protein EZS28_018302 [Streblomastix strix]|uniref:Protein kinase domain-containing protein n=1 Tax=Streblomastix strix TaxID=222440 RepID=A0A5J4VUD9_9EUKA|nr:MAG: hypothetical protein EZS28_018302 [Streblomastix strix]
MEYTTVKRGTQIYNAPELFPGLDIIDETVQNEEIKETTGADIWAFGITMYELLFQYHPFTNQGKITDQMQIILRIMKLKPEQPPEQYSANLRKLIMEMLKKDPAKRITAEQILTTPELANY